MIPDLVEFRLACEARLADGLEAVEGANAVDVRRVHGQLERRVHVALCGQVIEFIRLHLVQQRDLHARRALKSDATVVAQGL